MNTQDQQSQATTPTMEQKLTSSLSARSHIPVIAVVGLFLWGSIFLYLSTPKLLDALGGVLLYWLALFCAIFGIFAAFVFVCLALTFILEILYDHHHKLMIRRQYRMFNYQLFKQRMMQQCIRYPRQQELMKAYLTMRHNLLYRPPRNQNDVS